MYPTSYSNFVNPRFYSGMHAHLHQVWWYSHIIKHSRMIFLYLCRRSSSSFSVFFLFLLLLLLLLYLYVHRSWNEALDTFLTSSAFGESALSLPFYPLHTYARRGERWSSSFMSPYFLHGDTFLLALLSPTYNFLVRWTTKKIMHTDTTTFRRGKEVARKLRPFLPEISHSLCFLKKPMKIIRKGRSRKKREWLKEMPCVLPNFFFFCLIFK